MKILLVDNNPMNLLALTSFLDELGYETSTAADGLSALHLLDQFTPDVVITDLLTPNIGGDKLCRIIRDLPRLRQCFTIIIAAEEAGEDSGVCEADACIAKGKTSAIKERLREILERAGQRKSDSLYEVDLTLGLNQDHSGEITSELLNSRNYYADIVEDLDEGVLGLDREHRIIYANRAAILLAGVAEELLLTRDFTALFAESDRAAVRHGLQLLDRSADKEPHRIDNDPPLNLNGYFVTLKCLPLEVGKQRVIVVMIQDQSAKIIAARTIAAGNQRWQALFNEMPGGALLLEKSGPDNFTVIAANRAAADQFNLAPDQLIGRTPRQLWPHADQALTNLLQQVQQGGQAEDLAIGGDRCRCALMPSGELILLLH
ncbi:PAS domain-containing protein [Desulfurivibrio sp. D14AmB]|uniref:response regulator n=1 Tax=Desulfurivibrio sp. D14AmB TaxID=3374370 RepID=UPI00376EA95A